MSVLLVDRLVLLDFACGALMELEWMKRIERGSTLHLWVFFCGFSLLVTGFIFFFQ